MYARLFRIIDTVGAKTLTQTDRYVDERVGDFAANIVAPQGARLKRRVSVGAIVIGVVVVGVLGLGVLGDVLTPAALASLAGGVVTCTRSAGTAACFGVRGREHATRLGDLVQQHLLVLLRSDAVAAGDDAVARERQVRRVPDVLVHHLAEAVLTRPDARLTAPGRGAERCRPRRR